MDKDKTIELTNRVYKQTLLFPKKEPLRYKLREVADEILEDLIKIDNCTNLIKKSDFIADIHAKLEVVDAYLEIVKWQNWVSYFDIIKIKEEFNALRLNLSTLVVEREEKEEVRVAKGKSEKEAEDNEIDERKKKIIGILKEKERAQVGDIKKILPEISKRTLRRDFDVLIKKGLVERIGESNNTFYKLN